MGFLGDFELKKKKDGNILVRDRFTREKIGDICLKDNEVKIVKKKKG